MSSFRALTEVVATHGLPCALYTDRASHYFHTPKAGRQGRQGPADPGRARARAARHRAHPGLLAGGARPFRARLRHAAGPPAQGARAGTTTLEAASRFLAEVGLPEHNARFAVAPEQPETAFVADQAGAHRDILCVQEERVVGHRALSRPGPADPARPATAALRQGEGAGARRPGRHARNLPRAALPRPLSRRRRAAGGRPDAGRLMPLDGARPLWICGQACDLPTSPTGPTTTAINSCATNTGQLNPDSPDEFECLVTFSPDFANAVRGLG